METVEVDGLRIAYRRTGTGPALLLVHGGLGDSRDWRRQLEGLGDEFTVVAWDAPGCGGSDDPPETFRLPDYADCLAGFAAALGIGRPHVCGLSFGGGLALVAFAEADLRDLLPGIRVPTLLLYGDVDRRSPQAAVAAELHRGIPGSRLVVMPGVGHAANMEAPDRFNAEVREFLRSLP